MAQKNNGKSDRLNDVLISAPRGKRIPFQAPPVVKRDPTPIKNNEYRRDKGAVPHRQTDDRRDKSARAQNRSGHYNEQKAPARRPSDSFSAQQTQHGKKPMPMPMRPAPHTPQAAARQQQPMSGRQQSAARQQPPIRHPAAAAAAPAVKRPVFQPQLKNAFERMRLPDAPYIESSGLKNRGRFDMPMFTIVLILLVAGLVTMSSASYAYSLSEQSDSFQYTMDQIFGAVGGFILMCFFARLDYHSFITPRPLRRFFGALGRIMPGHAERERKRLRENSLKNSAQPENSNGINLAVLAFAAMTALMIYTCFFGDEVNGARRWLTIGIQFQPSELFKIALIVLMAYMLQRTYKAKRRIFHGFMIYMPILMLCCLLCLMQRHVSAMIIMFAIVYIMMLVGCCDLRCMSLMLVLAVLGLLFFIFVCPWDYLTDRIQSFLYPFSDTGDTTYQTSQSLITIGSGGWFGLGLGNSRQKYYYLPESQNDFVFAIICEELGFVGGMAIILLFVLFELRGFYIARRAKDKFGSLLALGITFHIGFQAMLNIGVACNAIPNTGISLPFFSYGRTALLIQLVEMGILLSVSRQSDT